jgi:dynein heavy chain, axonemal
MIPDVLKPSFRPVQMSVPEYECIAEITFIKSGFIQAHSLARKIVAIFKLSMQQLSSQEHYDFGLRNILLILSAAGKIKILNPNMQEENVVLWASSQIFMPKLITEDLVLFHQILGGLFPGLEQPQNDHTHLLSSFAFACERHNLTPSPYFSHKAVELYEILAVNHSILLVGETYGGKTSGLVALSEAIRKMSDQGRKNASKVQMSVVNPNSVTVAELFGYFNTNSNVWTDGILTKIFRDLNSDQENGRRWMVIDGHVDMMWGENLLTAMGGDKSLCLANGEVIKMQGSFSLIIETNDLRYASPSFVSRAGNVFYDPSMMTLDTFQRSWLRSLPDMISNSNRDHIQMLFKQFIPPCLEFMRCETEEIYPSCENSLVWSMMKIFDLLILDESFEKLLQVASNEAVLARIEGIFLFSVIWGICCNVKSSGRLKFDRFIRTLLLCSVQQHGQTEEMRCTVHSPIPDHNSIFHFYFHPEKAEWISWTSMISTNTLDATSTSQDIFVQTVDSVAFFYWLKLHSERTWGQSSHHKMPLMLVGPAAGKTTTINRYLSHLLESSAFSSLSMHFTEKTSSRQTQEAVQSKLEEKQNLIFGPVGTKRCIIFIDDVNMASIQVYGSRPPIELLRQYFCQKGWYDLSSGCFLQITGVNLVCTMGDVVGARALLPRRFVRWFHLIGTAGFDEEAIFSIYSAIAYIQGNLMEAPSIFKEITASLVRATMLVYAKCVESFQASPSNPHYIFRTSDIGRVVASTAFKYCPVEKESAVRLWAHETSREFFDRLSSDKDRIHFCDIMQDITEQCFALDLDTLTKHLDVSNSENPRYTRLRRLVFSDFQLGSNYAHEEFRNPDDVIQQAKLILTDHICKAYSVPPILFPYMIEHTLHLSRLLRAPGGSALLLGSAATGRRTCTKLAAYILDMKIIEIEPSSKAFGRLEWLECIKCALLLAGAESKKTVLYFADRQIHTQNILEDLGQLLRRSEISNLFTRKEFTETMISTRDSSQSVEWFQFMEQWSSNLHIVLSLRALGSQLAEILQHNPTLTSCCTIKWFGEWPIDSFVNVAKELIPRSEVGEGAWIACQEVSAKMHQTALDLSRAFSNETVQSAHVIPNMFFDFMYHFTKLLCIQRKSLESQIERCRSALDILCNFNIRYSKGAIEMPHSDPQTENGPVVQQQASRLISLLSGEISRWKFAANTFDLQKANLIGDVLLAAGYVTYLGVFSKHFRFEISPFFCFTQRCMKFF